MEGEDDPSRVRSHKDRNETGERLQKTLARLGFGSRRTCETMIVAGRVAVNGEVAVLGRRVEPGADRVEVDGVAVGTAVGLVYYLLNKPPGVVCTVAPGPAQRAVDLVPGEPRVFTVGRLDAMSEGLIVLTNDGKLAHLLTHPSHGVEKEYVVEVQGRPGRAAIRMLREGVGLDDGPTAPARVSLVGPSTLKLVIHEGRNRQVRRMCEAVGHPVLRLVRTRIGPLADRSLAPGTWRELSNSELHSLYGAAGPRSLSSRQAGDPRDA